MSKTIRTTRTLWDSDDRIDSLNKKGIKILPIKTCTQADRPSADIQLASNTERFRARMNAEMLPRFLEDNEDEQEQEEGNFF